MLFPMGNSFKIKTCQVSSKVNVIFFLIAFGIVCYVCVKWIWPVVRLSSLTHHVCGAIVKLLQCR